MAQDLGIILAMAVIVVAIMTWAAPPNPKSASASAAVTAVTVALRVAHHFLDNQRSVRKLTLLSRIRPLRSDDNRTGARRGH